MTTLKLILCEIPEKSNSRPPNGWWGEKNHAARGQKIFSPELLHFLPARLSEEIFKKLLFCR